MLGFRLPRLGIGIIELGEKREQACFIKWTHCPDVREIAPALRGMFHTPNGGKRDAITGGQMRALGVKPGVPDHLMPVVSGHDCGLALEFKSAVDRMPEQDEWADHLKLNGWLVLMVRSADAARAAVMHYPDVELPPL